jgi:hypothetical protein
MDSRLLGFDPETGIKETFHYDDTTGKFHIENEQVLDDLGELNTTVYNDVSTKSSTQWKGDMHHVASIPMVVYSEMVKTGMIHDQAALKKWLDDPDNRVFRVKPGSIR